MFNTKLKQEFDAPETERFTPEYKRLQTTLYNVRRRISNAKSEGQKQVLLTEYRSIRAQLLKTPAKSQTDKKLRYVRYADDFLIGVNGNREDCERVKAKIAQFIRETLKMELSEEKTLITHSSQCARFLGYDVRVRRNSQIKPSGRGFTKRTLNNKVELLIPLDDKIKKFLFDKKIVEQDDQGKIKPVRRTSLLRLTDLEIVSSYNAELRGICNYYHIASNFSQLSYFAYLMEYGCLKTLAAKHKTTTKKIIHMYKDGCGSWGIPYETKKGKKRMHFAKFAECKTKEISNDSITLNTTIHKNAITSFEDRLKARVCELCGTTESQYYEIHHVNKLKNLKGKEKWEIVMIAKRRKTIVLCRDCHNKIHQ